MKMKILPFYFESIPGELFEGHKAHPELKKILIRKLKLLIERSFWEQAVKREHLVYNEICKFLKIEPLISIKTVQAVKQDKSNAIKRTAERIKRYKEPKYAINNGYDENDIKYLVKKEINALKEATKGEESGQAFAIDYSKTQECFQYYLAQSVLSHVSRKLPNDYNIEDYKNGGEKALKIIENVRRHIPNRKGTEQMQKIVKKAGLYVDNLSQELKKEATDPARTIYLLYDLRTVTPITCVAESTTTNSKRYQKIILEEYPAGGVNENNCFVDTRDVLCRSEEICFSEALQAWIVDKNPNRWLCVGERINTNLLNYSAQPTEQKASALIALGKHLKHRVGFEIEFQELYSKTMCIKNKDGRPLTPSKVKEDTGWALCPDSSVKGGELKSPILYFSSPENVGMLKKQIPYEIRTFINNVAKDGNCGGHVNYSHETYTPTHCMMAIASWGFIWPLIPGVDERLLNEKLVNHAGYHFCNYQRIVDPAFKYQWIRQKGRCMEMRAFPAHWDVDALLWRAKLAALMIEDVEKKCKKIERTEAYHVLNYPRWENSLVTNAAKQNWEEFQDRENIIREHLRTVVTGREISQKIESESFKKRVKTVLGLTINSNINL